MPAAVGVTHPARSEFGKAFNDIRGVRRMADWQTYVEPLHLRIPDPRNLHVQIRAMSSVERLTESSAYGGDAESVYGLLSDRPDDASSYGGSMRDRRAPRLAARSIASNASNGQYEARRALQMRRKKQYKVELAAHLPQSQSFSTIASLESNAATPPLSREGSADLSYSSNSSYYQIATPTSIPRIDVLRSKETVTGSPCKQDCERMPKSHPTDGDIYIRSSPRAKIEASICSPHKSDEIPSDLAANRSRDNSFDKQSPAGRPLPRVPLASLQGDRNQISSDILSTRDLPEVKALQFKLKSLKNQSDYSLRHSNGKNRNDLGQKEDNKDLQILNIKGPFLQEEGGDVAKAMQSRPAAPISNFPSHPRPSDIFSRENFRLQNLPISRKGLSEAKTSPSILDRSRPPNCSKKTALNSLPAETEVISFRSQNLTSRVASNDGSNTLDDVHDRPTNHAPMPEPHQVREPSVLDRARPKLNKKIPERPTNSIDPLNVSKPGPSQEKLDKMADLDAPTSHFALASRKREQIQAREAELREAAKQELNLLKQKHLRQVHETHRMLLNGSWTPEATAVPQLPRLPQLNSSSTVNADLFEPHSPKPAPEEAHRSAKQRVDATSALEPGVTGSKHTVMVKTGVATVDALRFETALSQIPALTRTGAEKDLWVRQWAKAIVGRIDSEIEDSLVVNTAKGAESPVKKQLSLKQHSPIKLPMF